MADLILDAISLSGYSWSDVPDLVANILAGQALAQQFLDKKEVAKLKRLDDMVVQVGESFQHLSKIQGREYQLPDSIKTQLDDIHQDLCELKEHIFDAPKSKGKSLKDKLRVTHGEYLDELADKLIHSIKVLRFATSLGGYVLNQKSSALTKLIADPRACDAWTAQFGCDLSASPSFQDVVQMLDSFFHSFGESSLEFDANCSGSGSNSVFFSFYRHDGAWSKCDKCLISLRNRLAADVDGTVKLHLFAKFAGDNLLIAIRDLIIDTHPPHNKYEIVSPYLHIEEEVATEMVKLGGEPSKAQEKALKYNRILFVGSSGHLADLHQMICRQLCLSVNKIESVPDLNSFMDWIDEHAKEIKSNKGKVMIITNCQSHHHEHAENHVPSRLLAEKIYEYLLMNEMMSVAIGLLTCPFLTHGPEQIQELQDLLLKGHFSNFALSTDARQLTLYIQDMFKVTEKAAKSGGKKKAKDKFTTDLVNDEVMRALQEDKARSSVLAEMPSE